MSINSNKKLQVTNTSNQLSLMNHQIESQVKRILQDLSSIRVNQLKTSTASMSDSIFSLKLLKYDTKAQQNRKFQIRNHFSPPKWKGKPVSYSISTNYNSEFSHNQRVKGKILTGWDIQRLNLSKRSYRHPKQFHGIKADLFSREFPNDLSKTYSKGFNKKLKQIQSDYEKRVLGGNIKNIEEKRQHSIDAIRSRGTKFQLSKNKLFGFVTPLKSSNAKEKKLRSTISHFYQREN